MSIIIFLAFGLVVGLLARAFMPGPQPMGMLATVLLGVAGSFFGGVLGNLVSGHRVTDLHTVGVIGSVVGAFLLLAIMRGVSGRGPRSIA